MILLTVGTQLAFDRLTTAIDDWIDVDPRSLEVIGQIGPSEYRPHNFRAQQFFAPDELDALVSSAELIISHAGMGSIITALTSGKPIIIVPRRADLSEHRNDHQLATARKFIGHEYVRPVFDVAELGPSIDELLQHSERRPVSPFAPAAMTDKLKTLING